MDDATVGAHLCALRNFKVQIAMRPIGMAPKMKQPNFQIDGFITFQFLHKKMKQLLKIPEENSLYLYLQNSFIPERDECVADLWSCFKGPGESLVFSYSLEPSYS
eukprot:g13693.t1